MDDDEPMAVEVFREKTIEDIIEEQRAKLAAEGKKGTPVTAETFAIWRAGKILRKQQEAEARVKLEQSKKKGGKGLSVLSGKELFSYNSSLFVDDEAAINAQEENELAEESKKSADEESAREKIDQERAQAEQLRLAEIQRIEIEVKLHKYEEKRRLAALGQLTFMLGDVIINEAVFDEEDFEDLTPFPDIVEIISNDEFISSAEEFYSAENSSYEVNFQVGEDEEGEDGDNEDSDGDDNNDDDGEED